MATDFVRGVQEIRNSVIAEYRQAIGNDSSAEYGSIKLNYPAITFSYPIKINDSDSSDDKDSNEVIEDEPIDKYIVEVRHKQK